MNFDCSDIDFDLTKYKRSSKIESVLHVINKAVAQNEKCVIYTQFLGMISLFEHELNQSNISHCVTYLNIF